MDLDLFQELLQKAGPRLAKQNTVYRTALHEDSHLVITLRHLITSDSYGTSMYGFRVAQNTIDRIVKKLVKSSLISTWRKWSTHP